MFYHPSVPRAFDDMKGSTSSWSTGVFLRNLHRWGRAVWWRSSLHMLRVFFAGAYRPPREFNWVLAFLPLL